MKFDKWTPEEDAILRSFWTKEGSLRNFEHLLPKRSKKAIEKRGQKLELGHRIRWTEEQDARIREIWKSGRPIKQFASEFPTHSWASISIRMYTLRLGKRPQRSDGTQSVSRKLIKTQLGKRDQTAQMLHVTTGLNVSTIYGTLKAIQANGEIHIAAWERSIRSGKLLPIYRFGAGKEAPKPPKLTSTEKQRRYRATVKSSKNPFATAAGLISAPVTAVQGRIVTNLHDFAEAA
jgi:hypothetical protein